MRTLHGRQVGWAELQLCEHARVRAMRALAAITSWLERRLETSQEKKRQQLLGCLAGGGKPIEEAKKEIHHQHGHYICTRAGTHCGTHS